MKIYNENVVHRQMRFGKYAVYNSKKSKTLFCAKG